MTPPNGRKHTGEHPLRARFLKRLERDGLSMRQWARRHKWATPTVSQVLSGRDRSARLIQRIQRYLAS